MVNYSGRAPKRYKCALPFNDTIFANGFAGCALSARADGGCAPRSVSACA
jgi:hypothetical protein